MRAPAVTLLLLLTTIGAAGRAENQLGQLQGRIGQAKEALQKANKAVHDLKFTADEEHQLGSDVSAKLRDRYGVVQDEALHKYVTLVGSVVAARSSSAQLPWTFIVLDTDGVNAFAAPGGFVHVTRGALALIRNEAELAGVIGHEIGHVMARHTIRAIQKAKVEGALAKAATRSDFLQQVGNRLYAITLENSFDRGDEMEADKVGVALASDAGYTPAGLGAFLASLAERNKASTERSGLFASHPDSKARQDAIAKEIRNQPSFTGKAVVQARYNANTPRTGGSGAFGLAGMKPLGAEKGSSSTIASAGSRGVNPDRDARGGPNKGLVVVTVTPDEIAEFRKGIAG